MPLWEEVNTCLMPVDTSPGCFFFFYLGKKVYCKAMRGDRFLVHSCLEKLQVSLKGFSKAFLKGRWAGSVSRYGISLYTIPWLMMRQPSGVMVSYGLAWSVLRLQEAWIVCSGSSSSSCIWWGKRDSHLQNHSGNVHQILLSGCFREELKQRTWGGFHRVQLGYKSPHQSSCC